ncbi:MAG: sulfopyruvate decarboxylase [Deltaproteobacteria bacterium]|nr:sulfopyruvate decarboxylase [Deltaproteobacteria bacterium]
MRDDIAAEAHRSITEAGIDFMACMPDSAFLELYQRVEADTDIRYIQVANESDGVGICMGAWIGGARPALLMENTGFALSCYALLRGPAAFGVPMLLLISYRGGFGDQRWFSVPFGWATEPLLQSLRIQYSVVNEPGDLRHAIVDAVHSMNAMQAPVAVLFPPRLFF